MLQVPTSRHHHQGGAPKQAPRLPNAPALVPLCKSACTRITAGRLGTAVQHISSADGKSAKMLGSSQAKMLRVSTGAPTALISWSRSALR